MELSLAKNSQRKDAAEAAVSVLLLDTPENLGVDFLQSLQKRNMKLAFERVNDKEGLFNALKKENWDILLVCDQVNVPGLDETLAYLNQLDCETSYVLLKKGELSIDFLTESYRKGISAVVSHQHPDYSFEVFVREAERSRRNFQLSQLNQEKFELARHRDQLMSGTEEALAYLQDGIHVYGNDAYLKMLGYVSMDDLIIMPFIDIVSTEMREKTKQMLLDFQHKVRVNEEAEELEIPELFAEGIGEKEGILQLSATFKPVVYDGEDCIQVVFKDLSAREGREESGSSVEGLGYPLFVTHLDNYIAEAQEAGRLMGHVVNIRGNGFEHYIAVKGFGGLNGKLKALASELKSGLSREDLLIRFTENSFLILLRGGGSANPDDNSLIKDLEQLLSNFETALNNEIGLKDQDPVITFSHDIIPVDANSKSAEELIKALLLEKDSGTEPAAAGASGPAENNVISFADKTAGGTGVKQEAKEKAEPEAAAKSDPGAESETPEESSEPVAEESETVTGEDEGDGESGPAPGESATQPEAVVETSTQQPAEEESIFSQEQLNTALNSNALSLYYDTVISVTDIETEFYDIALYLRDEHKQISRGNMGAALNNSPLASKLDLWMLHKALTVSGDLYKQGLEHRFLMPFSARSLEVKGLVESVQKELASFGLPGEMIALDFSVSDLNANPSVTCAQLEKLRAAGIRICVSDIYPIRELKDILQQTSINLVRLQSVFIEKAAADEKAFSLLKQSVEKLHERKIKVLAGDIHGNEALSVCCKARIDLVKGEYIQKSPQELSVDSLSQGMVI